MIKDIKWKLNTQLRTSNVSVNDTQHCTKPATKKNPNAEVVVRHTRQNDSSN